MRDLPTNTPRLGLPKGQGADNARDYLKGAISGGGLWKALEILDNAILEGSVNDLDDVTLTSPNIGADQWTDAQHTHASAGHRGQHAGAGHHAVHADAADARRVGGDDLRRGRHPLPHGAGGAAGGHPPGGGHGGGGVGRALPRAPGRRRGRSVGRRWWEPDGALPTTPTSTGPPSVPWRAGRCQLRAPDRRRGRGTHRPLRRRRSHPDLHHPPGPRPHRHPHPDPGRGAARSQGGGAAGDRWRGRWRSHDRPRRRRGSPTSTRPGAPSASPRTRADRLSLNRTTGTLTLTPDAGQPGLVTPRIDGPPGQNLLVYAPSTVFAPAVDAGMNLGHTALRWYTVYAISGTDQHHLPGGQGGHHPARPGAGDGGGAEHRGGDLRLRGPRPGAGVVRPPGRPGAGGAGAAAAPDGGAPGGGGAPPARLHSEDADPLFLVGEGQTIPGFERGRLARRFAAT